MLEVLRQFTLEELHEVTRLCGLAPDAPLDAVVRVLCRECGVSALGGMWPLSREEDLFEHMGVHLGVTALPPGPRSLARLECSVFAVLFRKAWQCLEPPEQRRVLELALFYWDEPERLAVELPLSGTIGLETGLDSLMAHPAGLRALAVASEEAPVPYPVTGAAGTRSVVGSLLGLRLRGRNLPLLYEVLLRCWRVRRRLIVERRMQRDQLARQVRHIEALLEAQAREVEATPLAWFRRPTSGLSVAAGTAVAGGLQWSLGLLAAPHVVIPLAGAGLVWASAAHFSRPRAESDPRYQRLRREINRLRQQLAIVDQDIRVLNLHSP